MAGLFIYALVTKDVMQSLLMGTFSMYILWYKFGSIIAFFAIVKLFWQMKKILKCICLSSFVVD